MDQLERTRATEVHSFRMSVDWTARRLSPPPRKRVCGRASKGVYRPLLLPGERRGQLRAQRRDEVGRRHDVEGELLLAR